MTTLQLELASEKDILTILRQTRSIWSGGLSADKYIESIHNQRAQPWAKKNLRSLLLRSDNEICASLKFYSISMQGRSKTFAREFNLAGLGAIYTMIKYRRQGIGSNLVRAAIDLAKKEKRDGLLLFSDIEPDFYANLGFVDLGSYNFDIQTDKIRQEQPFTANLVDLDSKYLPAVSLSYNRWLARRQYGCQRNSLFWNYKVAREKFFQEFSGKEWPGIKLLTQASADDDFRAYALIESSSTTLRVLEVAATERELDLLWQQIVALAHHKGLKRIRGFEGIATGQMKFPLVKRDWAVPMLLPLNTALERWLDVETCPFLELDHF